MLLSAGFVSLLNENGVNTMKMVMKCTHCGTEFPPDKYQDHCCHYNERGQFIFDEPLMERLWTKSTLRQLLSDNIRNASRLLNKHDTLDNSMQSQDNETANYVCSICKRMYVHASGLKKHLDTHGNDCKRNWTTAQRQELFKCSICYRLLKSVDSLIEHRKAEHSDSVFDLLTSVVLESTLHCEFCEFLFEDEAALLEHEASHNSVRGFECTQCRIYTRFLNDIVRHRNAECPSVIYSLDDSPILKSFLSVMNAIISLIPLKNFMTTGRTFWRLLLISKMNLYLFRNVDTKKSMSSLYSTMSSRAMNICAKNVASHSVLRLK